MNFHDIMRDISPYQIRPLAEKLEDLLAELQARNPTDMRGTLVPDDVRAMRRVRALNQYLLALRLNLISSDKNAMFDRLSAGIAGCRDILGVKDVEAVP